ncbi:MAG: phenylacetic acid degradation bifunctional protein PaaZ [Nitriliruptoraceae bacterium]|nr:phenylacetic acid degradation bifunctional protein PaaZ [Nitriliruptoraceae bacterium]
MTRTLSSYVAGTWITPDGGEAVVSPVTGATICQVSTDGVDDGEAVRHAREVGGPALRALTFHQRAWLLKDLVKVIAAHKQDLYELSALSGATSKDAWVDVDGGMGAVATYSSQGRRFLPDAHVVVDGPVQPLSRDGSFAGVHVGSPKEGVAVQINAFNFPVWGSLEKLAPALLAGMPSIVKPATPTAYVAEALYRAIIDSGVLPEGAVQFIAGPVHDLFDHLDGQDLVGFTGSAATASHLRTHPAFTSRSAIFTAETDSLNSSILLPSGAEGAHLDRFVTEVATELTTKAGQRCTAIRRAFVPASHTDEVVTKLRAQLAEVVLGDPRVEGVTMGSLVSAGARAGVERTVEKLLPGARRVIGDEPLPLVGDVDDAAFMPPTVLLADDASRDEVHTLEPFGPVTTLIPYDTVDEAVALIRRGGGSLVASAFGPAGADDAIALFAGIAAHHGRLLFVDDAAAASQTGHGSPLPHLVHGGPGRAGGGEELGGLRAVHHHLQTTAVQGSPDQLTALTGRYVPGAARDTSGPHPFTKRFEELSIGDALITGEREVTLEDIEAFAALTGDTFYAHMDEVAAKASPIFEGRVAHGYLLVSAAAGLFVWPDPGPVLANVGLEDLQFAQPVYPGDRIHVRFTCKDKGSARDPDQGTVTWDVEVVNQRDEVVATYDVLTVVAR